MLARAGTEYRELFRHRQCTPKESARETSGYGEFVVSGDRHLLALKHHANITMISLADFLTKLHR
jgi:hypothetical protein